MSVKALAAGVKPTISEHREILDALSRRDPSAARAAMHDHLSRVIASLLEATEVEEVEQARAPRRRAPPPPRTARYRRRHTEPGARPDSAGFSASAALLRSGSVGLTSSPRPPAGRLQRLGDTSRSCSSPRLTSAIEPFAVVDHVLAGGPIAFQQAR
jgi:hypothetical protein